MNTELKVISGGTVTSSKGFLAGAVYAGIKKKNNNVLDLGILYTERPCTAAALFTTNRIKAAPIVLSQKKIKSGKCRAIVINSGCANACTGEQGLFDAASTSEIAATKLGVSSKEVLIASTGVIGVNLPMEKIKEGIGRIILSRNSGHELTRAIMTTDTRPKEIAVKAGIGKKAFTIAGIAKGAGMIHPDMATMLCFLTTDADVEATFLKKALKKAVDISLNMVSVDGDTSTNDMVLLMANGMAHNDTITENDEQAEVFQQALDQVCIYLAKCIARDGEGAGKIIEISVNRASNVSDARKIARTIATSPLVKTAIHGCDPNWGRVIAAAGRSGVAIEESKIDLYIGGMCLLKEGTPVPFDKKAAVALLKKEEIPILIELGMGKASAVAWGCDLSAEYVAINSDYTT